MTLGTISVGGTVAGNVPTDAPTSASRPTLFASEEEARSSWLAGADALRVVLMAPADYDLRTVPVSPAKVVKLLPAGMGFSDAIERSWEIMRAQVGPLPGSDALGAAMALGVQLAFVGGVLGAIPISAGALLSSLRKLDPAKLTSNQATALVQVVESLVMQSDKEGPRLTAIGRFVARLGLSALFGGEAVDKIKALFNRYGVLIAVILTAVKSLCVTLGYTAVVKGIDIAASLLSVGTVSPETAGTIASVIAAGIALYGGGRKLWAIIGDALKPAQA